MFNKTIKILIVTAIFGTAMIFSGCDSDAKTGTALGAAVGTAAGAIIGYQTGHGAGGALIGAAAGAGTGYLLGNVGDQNKAAANNQAQINSIRQDMQYASVPINNSNGSVIEVRLLKQGTVYIGPKGETYNSMPTGEQLRPVYGF